MLDQLLNVRAGGLQILAGVELVGMLVEELTDCASHSQTKIGVNINLANGGTGGLTQLLLRNTNGVGHFAAVGINHLHVVLGYGGGAVKHDGEARQTLDYLVENVKTQGRGNQLALLVAGTLSGSEGGTSSPFSLRVH